MNVIIFCLYYPLFAFILVLSVITLFKLKQSAGDIGKSFKECDSIETFLMIHNKKFPVLAFSKILPGIFVGFGILGTFLGFAKGITGIDMNGTSDEIFNEIGELLFGMHNAFWTSIVGVALSAIFSFLFQLPIHELKSYFCSVKIKKSEEEREVGNSFDSYTNQVREFTQTLINAKESVEALPEKFLNVGNCVNELLTPVKEIFSQMQGVLESYSEQAKVMHEASNEAKESVANISALPEKFMDVGNSLNESILLVKEIYPQMQSILQSYSEQAKMMQEASSDSKDSVQNLSVLPEKFMDVGNVLNESVMPVKEIFSQMQGVLEGYSEQAKAMQEASNETKESVQKLSESTEGVIQNISAIFEESKSLNANVAEEKNSILDMHKKAMEDYAEIDKNISSIIENLNNNLSAYSEAIGNSLVETLQHFTDAAQKISESLFGD